MKKLLCLIFFAIFLCLTVSFTTYGAIITVGPGKTHATITAALNACSAGDTIDIYDDTYREGYEITASTKDWDGLTIQAASGESEVYWQSDNATYAASGGSRWSVHNGNIYKTASAAFSGNRMYAVFYEHPSSGLVWRCKQETALNDINADDEFFHDSATGIVYVQLADRTLGRDPDSYIMRLNNTNDGTIANLSITVDSARDINNITIKGIIFQFCSLGSTTIFHKGAIYTADESVTYDLDSLTLQNCIFRYIGDTALDIQGENGSVSKNGPDNVLVDNCVFDTCGGYDDAGEEDNQYETINLGYGTIRVIIQGCTFDNAYRHHISWLGPDTVAKGNPDANKYLTLKRCVLKGGASYGPTWGHSTSSGLRATGTYADFTVQNCIISGMGHHGIHKGFNGEDCGPRVVKIYNNTIVYNGQSGTSEYMNIETHRPMPTTTLEIKGNIIWGMRGGTNRRELYTFGALPGDGRDVDYNLWDSEVQDSNYPIRYIGVNRTWAQWIALSIGGHTPDQNSLEEDFSTDSNYPDFLDNQTDGSGDYHIGPNSPCIDAGTDLGDSVSLDPDSSSQYDDGRWDIGGYRFKKAGGGE